MNGVRNVATVVLSVAVAVTAVVAAGDAVPAAEAEAPRPVSAGGICWQLGASALLEVGVGLAGYGLMYQALGGWATSDDTQGGKAAGFFFGLSLFATYPLAATVGTYLAGEKVGGPAANKGATFGCSTFAAYGQTLLFVGLGAAARAGEEGYVWALAVDAATKPVLTTYVYHKVKKPAAPAEESRGPTLEPYVSLAAGGDGRAVPLYGVTLSF